MAANDPRDWMWAEALDMISRAERMHQQLFQPQPTRAAAAWAPPIDMLETDDGVMVVAALPGVDAEAVQTVIDGDCLIISGQRVLPPELRTAVIHRLELPQGRFERRVRLPAGRYSQVVRRAVNGCLVITLHKA